MIESFFGLLQDHSTAENLAGDLFSTRIRFFRSSLVVLKVQVALRSLKDSLLSMNNCYLRKEENVPKPWKL